MPTPPKAKTNTFTVVEPAELLKFMIAMMPSKGRNALKSVLGYHQVKVNGKATTKFNFALNKGDLVEVNWEKALEKKPFRGIKIRYEDDYLIVIEKQAGILSIATEKEKQLTAYSQLSAHVKSQHPGAYIFVVHRLDRDTSGLMIFAKSPEIQEKLQGTWAEKTIHRTYAAIVEGVLNKPNDTISSYLVESKALKMHSGKNPEIGKKAVTHYKLIQQNPQFALLDVTLDTGRKNQIRVHMSDIGHPVAGDKKYGAKTNPFGRLGLHAKSIRFTHPVTNEKMSFECDMPFKFKQLFADAVINK